MFGPAGDQPLDGDVVRARFAALAAEIERATGSARSPEEVAEGFIDIAVGNMANAIKKISVARGYDVTRYALQCFGGAGGQHACRVADALGMTRCSPIRWPACSPPTAWAWPTGRDARGGGRAAAGLGRHGAGGAARRARRRRRGRAGAPGRAAGADLVHRRVHVRYDGTDSALVVPFGDVEAMRAAFEAAYRQRFAFLMSERRLVVEAVSVEAVGAGDAPAETRPVVATAPRRPASVRMFCEGRWRDAALVEREMPGPGRSSTARRSSPSATPRPSSSPAGGRGHRPRPPGAGARRAARGPPRDRHHVDPVMLEVFNNLFMNIAEQMGLQLQNTAYSVNIKERLDFSCALFDADGNLIANAPHMPVHLGSMSESIKTVIARNAGQMQPGDVYVLNDPYHGGTHLPDVTVVTPVYLEGQGERDRLTFYVGSRGHHADIGGTTPGSMPPFSTRIDEEGVQIDNVKLAAGGRLLEAEMLALLQSGAHPSRNPEQNLADLKAQVAANEKGVHELRAMVAQFGLDVVQGYMRHVQDNAEESVRRVITKLQDGAFALPLDNGAVIRVAIRVDAAGRSAEIDFTGTSPQLPNNFNAPTAVCMAAVLYVFRTLVDDDIPLNAGCLKPLKVIIPEGSMLNPEPPASVVAGNVETSTCITNALYGALGAMGASQGTMNNFTFGNDRHQYYETISGGSGAGDGFDGTSVVQTHMTNSRLTDPEVLEFRFPVRLDGYAIRPGSGGRAAGTAATAPCGGSASSSR